MVVCLAILGGVACTPQYGGGGAVQTPTCPTITRWAVGDSFTTGVNGIAGWPDQNPPIPTGKYANKGVPGSVVPQLLAQTQADFLQCGTNATPLPTKVVFLAGANDMANSHLVLSQMETNIDALASYLQSKGVPFKLVSVLPIPATADWTGWNAQRLAYNAYMQSKYPTKYIDCATPLTGSDGWMNPAYAYGDRAHLNLAGFQLLAGCIDAAA
jgi:lysophospholipase L1-like esterase